MFLLSPKVLIFLRWCQQWQNLLRKLNVVLEANFNVLSKIMLRYLYSSTISTFVLWIVLTQEVRATGLGLLIEYSDRCTFLIINTFYDIVQSISL